MQVHGEMSIDKHNKNAAPVPVNRHILLQAHFRTVAKPPTNNVDV
jgi:hypothetical protein